MPLGRNGSTIFTWRESLNVFKFLKWKNLNYPDSISDEDRRIIDEGNIENFLKLTNEAGKYSKGMITKYTEDVWKKSLENEFQQDGLWHTPNPSCKGIPINSDIREVEVLVLSLLYKNNLLNEFLHGMNSNKFCSPLCTCGREEQNAHHVLFRCPLVKAELRAEAYHELEQAVGRETASIEDTITLLNASRYQPFMEKVMEIVTELRGVLRTSIEL